MQNALKKISKEIKSKIYNILVGFSGAQKGLFGKSSFDQKYHARGPLK
jgi:hypothetical protein